MAGARMRVPSLIDLRKGHPKARNLPHAKMAWAARRAAARLDASDESTFALCYSAGSSGNPLFVQRLARFLSDSYGTPCFADNLFTTNGVSHGIELACAALTAPGDAVWVEGATYFLAHQIFVDHRLKVTALPTDAHGLDTDALASFLASGELGAPPAMVYLVPTHGNPSGATLPLERRRALVDLAKQYNFICLSDDVYHLLDWSQLHGCRVPPRLYELDPAFTAQVAERASSPAGCANGDGIEHPEAQEDSAYTGAAATGQDAGGDGSGRTWTGDGCVLSLGSFSKILAPGLRLGWIEASPSLISRISERGYVISGGSVAPFVSEIVAEMLPVLGAAGSGSADASGGGEGVGFGADGVGAGAEAGDGEPPIATETADEIATKTASAVVHAPSTGPCGLDHGVAAHLSHLVRDYSSACDAMIRAVRSAAPDLSIVSEPRGGFFAWVQLPAGVSADALLPIAERHGVLFLPGRACAPSCPPEAFDRYARLCFAMEEPAEIEEGVRRLAAAVKEARGATA